MQRAEVAYAAATRQGHQEIENLANALPVEQQLDRNQRQNLFSTDIIVRGSLDGQLTYMAIVGASLTRRLSPTILAPQAEFPTISAPSFNNLPHRNNEPPPQPIRQDVLLLSLDPRE